MHASSAAVTLALELLGVGVSLSTNDEDAGRKLALCYGVSGVQDPGPEPLHGKLTRTGSRWRISIEGRDELEEEDPIAAVRTFNHELLHGVMRRAPQLFYVHACVVSHSGRGIVLPGLTQAGKSTLGLMLVRLGARYVSDELLAFDSARSVALAYPRAFKIRDVCVPYFSELSAKFVGTGEGRFLPFEHLPAEAVVAETPVSAVVVPHWSAGGSNELEPLSRGQALLELTRSALNFGTHRAASVEHLAGVVASASAFRLEWSDARSAAETILAALDREPR